MKSSEICALAIQCVSGAYGEIQYRLGNTLYYADDLQWCNMTWGGPAGYYSDAWHSDCLGFVRAMLCGWNANKQVYGGGANINPNDPGAYRCAFFNEAAFLDSCTSRSSDFTSVPACSLLYKSGHVGLFVGEYQLDGKTYNTCECCYGLKYGGHPTWTDPATGMRQTEKGGPQTDSFWEYWGTFNLNGTDYGITEYDGGAIGATGFGSALTQTEVNFYWDTLQNLTYDYVESIAESIHEMPADVFAVMAGWGWGEAYSRVPPVGETDPDKYMAYLCDCVPVNYFEGLGINTGPAMAAAIAGGDTGGYYDYTAMVQRANDLKDAEDTSAGQNELKALLLALLNPDQNAYFCSGYPAATDVIIYQNDYPGEGTIYVFYNPSYKVDYDITGTGIRGGQPTPSGRGKTRIPSWMYLRPWQHYNSYRLLI